MGPIFRAIQEAGPGHEHVFSFTYPELVDNFAKAVAQLHLPHLSLTSFGTRDQAGTSCMHGEARLP